MSQSEYTFDRYERVDQKTMAEVEWYEVVQRIRVDHYYFGLIFRKGLCLTSQRRDVLDKLVEWHKGDPKPWASRAYKPYFNDWSIPPIVRG